MSDAPTPTIDAPAAWNALLDLSDIMPVAMVTQRMVDAAFGEHSTQKFRLWAVEHGLRIFYVPATLRYLLVPQRYKEW